MGALVGRAPAGFFYEGNYHVLADLLLLVNVQLLIEDDQFGSVGAVGDLPTGFNSLFGQPGAAGLLRAGDSGVDGTYYCGHLVVWVRGETAVTMIFYLFLMFFQLAKGILRA